MPLQMFNPVHTYYINLNEYQVVSMNYMEINYILTVLQECTSLFHNKSFGLKTQ